MKNEWFINGPSHEINKGPIIYSVFADFDNVS